MTTDLITGLAPSVLQEFMYHFTGKRLGSGSSRVTFAHPFDKTKVIKMENRADTFQNVREWEFWNDMRHVKKVAEWLAPCHNISYNGTFLVMERTTDIIKPPAKLPKFLTDHKLENFGMLNGRVVCRDYGHVIYNIDDKHRKWNGTMQGYE
jgi:hypothetical protein